MQFCRYFAIAILVCTVGCAAARTNHFNTFAEAGKMYVTASQTVIKDAGTAAVETDTQFLVAHRSDMDPQQRRSTLTQSDTLLRQRLELLRLVSVHAELLQQYFEALSALSDPKTGGSLGTAAQSCFDSIKGMSPKLKEGKIGGMDVSSFMPAVTAPVVAEFKARALNEELHARSEAMTRELALQQAAFSLIAQELKTDTQEQLNFKQTKSINEYVANAPLPGDWASDREAILSTPTTVASAEAAAKAAAQLRKAFTALVENRPESGNLSALMSDISNVITMAQGIQGGGDGGGDKEK